MNEQLAHVRIEIPDHGGGKAIALYDRIIVVGDNGTEIDISAAIRGYTIPRRWNEIALVQFDIMGCRIIDVPPPTPRTTPPADPDALGTREPRRPEPPLDAVGVTLDAPKGKTST